MMPRKSLMSVQSKIVIVIATSPVMMKPGVTGPIAMDNANRQEQGTGLNGLSGQSLVRMWTVYG